MERALRKIAEKGPIPDIDYTRHELENGVMVSTQERVIKDVSN